MSNIKGGLTEMVKKFIERFQIESCTADSEEYQKRLLHMKEELEELAAAESGADRLDAMCDLVYLVIGTALMLGYDFAKAFTRVHTANMMRMRVIGSDDHKFGMMKPEGWEPPDLEDCV